MFGSWRLHVLYGNKESYHQCLWWVLTFYKARPSQTPNTSMCVSVILISPVIDDGDILYKHAACSNLSSTDSVYQASSRFNTKAKYLTHSRILYYYIWMVVHHCPLPDNSSGIYSNLPLYPSLSTTYAPSSGCFIEENILCIFSGLSFGFLITYCPVLQLCIHPLSFLVSAPDSLSSPPPEYPDRSDWSAHTRLSQHCAQQQSSSPKATFTCQTCREA